MRLPSPRGEDVLHGIVSVPDKVFPRGGGGIKKKWKGMFENSHGWRAGEKLFGR